MITGESGTGKEVVARSIHRLSRRESKPFVAINAAAIPESLIESELFGHERGAFTGAVATRSGVFEQANGGTLLIDEIAEMPMSLQPKLLRVLADGRVRRLGGNYEFEFDARVLALRPEKLVFSVGETTVADAERELILRTLEHAGKNKAEAARQLGVDVKTIYNKLKAYGIEE